jgi:hypothetical protein
MFDTLLPITEVRRIGGIECLRAEFQFAFPDCESPENTKIRLKVPGPRKY